MGNKIVIGNNEITLDDSHIISGSIHTENALIDESLTVDEITTDIRVVNSEPLQDVNGISLLDVNGVELYSGGLDIAGIPYAKEITYSHDNKLIGKFYKDTAKRLDNEIWRITGFSGVGLLDSQIHYGGLYNATPAKQVIADIMDAELVSSTSETETYSGVFTYILENSVGDVALTGWLPIETRRLALQNTLFALGASIIKDDNGVVNIKFSQPSSSETLTTDDLMIDPEFEDLTPVTDVNITEHEYIETSLDKSVKLLDTGNDTVEDMLVSFEKPCYDLTYTGTLVASESGVNYAIVSGKGTITGTEYTHNTRVIHKTTGVSGMTKEVSVKDATLVTSANSDNVANRVAYYYGNRKVIQYDFIVDDERTGDSVVVPHPYRPLDLLSGYIQQMDTEMSANLKAKSKIVVNWTPKYVGNTYDAYRIITASDLVNGVWNVPNDMQGCKARVVFFSGAKGGQGGLKGDNGSSALYESIMWMASSGGGAGGAGGAGGEGGEFGGYVNHKEYTSLGSSYSVTFGAGGAGGAINGGNGSVGSATIFDGTSSNQGTAQPTNYVNIIDGTIYCMKGMSGNAGARGGNGGSTEIVTIDAGNDTFYKYQTATIGYAGSPLGSHVGGQGGTMGSATGVGGTSQIAGGGGGGASVDADGSAGVSSGGGIKNWTLTPSYATFYANANVGRNGGVGANATSVPVQATDYGRGGTGGNGGGGGGGAGGASGEYIFSHEDHGRYYSWWVTAEQNNYGGSGGNGSRGGQGANGFAIVYYRTQA